MDTTEEPVLHIMSQNRRTVSKMEFNKRVRDLVSRDSNRLRQTFQQFDKECASRLAEIQSMQEKVRHSMRNLTQEKMQARAEFGNFHRGARRESETERGNVYPDQHQQGSSPDTKASSIDERMKLNNKTSLPGIHFNRSEHLGIPNRAGQARRRRYSLPHPPTFLPGSPKESRALPIHTSHPRTSMASSLSKEAFVKPGSPSESSLMSNLSSSPKESLHGMHLLWPENAGHRKNDYRLSISELPISSSRADPMSSVRIKLSPQLDRKGHTIVSKDDIVEDDQGIGAEPVKDETSEDEKSENCDKDGKNPRGSHTSLSRQHEQAENRSLDVTIETGTMETEPRRVTDSNNAKSGVHHPERLSPIPPKTLLKRTRSSSLPCDPDLMKNLKPRDSHRSGVSRASRSANRATSATKRASSPAVPVPTILKDKESASRAFEELRHCRYLRTTDIED